MEARSEGTEDVFWAMIGRLTWRKLCCHKLSQHDISRYLSGSSWLPNACEVKSREGGNIGQTIAEKKLGPHRAASLIREKFLGANDQSNIELSNKSPSQQNRVSSSDHPGKHQHTSTLVMPRSASDATRFTATGPFVSAKPPGSSIQLGGSAPSNETAQEKIARLRAAAAQARAGQESQFDKVVRVGRTWADRAHRFTTWSLIGLTGMFLQARSTRKLRLTI